MPARRLRVLAPILALLVALGGLVGLGVIGGSGDDTAGPARVESVDVPTQPSDTAAVIRASTDHLRTLVAPSGPAVAWLGATVAGAAALAASVVPPRAVAVPSRTTAHVRRRGPPSPV